MAGKHSDHYFCRWQAKIVTTIIFYFQKNEKNEKCLEFSDLARKLIRKTVRQFLPPPDMCAEKFRLVSMGGRAEGIACADPGARTPIGASGNFYISFNTLFYFI